eukprot:scaffold48708_cov63-Phaeocystis_antarctica.AAC.3
MLGHGLSDMPHAGEALVEVDGIARPDLHHVRPVVRSERRAPLGDQHALGVVVSVVVKLRSEPRISSEHVAARLTASSSPGDGVGPAHVELAGLRWLLRRPRLGEGLELLGDCARAGAGAQRVGALSV